MKKTTRFSEANTIIIQTIIMVALLFSMGMLLQGCTDQCETTQKYVYYEPVYTTMEEIRASVVFDEPAALHNPGKIYLKGDFIYINEAGRGIHVINNADPANPVKSGFINIPGTYDMAIRGDILYADSYMDLLAIDISNGDDIRVVNRIENLIWEDNGFVLAGDQGIITDWREMEVVEMLESACNGGSQRFFPFRNGYAADISLSSSSFAAEMASAMPGPGSGKGGSMARFTIVDQYLYTVDHSTLKVFNISNPESPVSGSKLNLGWGIETIFPYKENLFIGAQNGMHIVDNSTPSNPSLLSTYAHITSCDPVVVEDEFAYVTLRSGTECQGFTNQLDVINISDLVNPQLIKSYPMENPHGLGINQNALFICEGEYGLKIFNAEDKLNINENLLAHFKDLHAYDVILNGQNLILIGKDGLYQYDYEDLDNVKLLSFLPVIPENSNSHISHLSKRK
ncbi:hypothetical protein BH23BAC1_BH23BAC1_15330 [soil metagenome]